MAVTHAQIVPVSRLGTLTTYTDSTATGPVVNVATFTDWASGTVGPDASNGQTIAVAPGAISAACATTGWHTTTSTGGGQGTHIFSSYSTTSTVALTFDILSPATFTLSGTASWGYSNGSVVLAAADGGPVLYSFTRSGEFGSAPVTGNGALAPGRYVFTVTTASAALSAGGMGSGPFAMGNFGATLTVTPAPGAGAALALGGLVAARRRRR